MFVPKFGFISFIFTGAIGQWNDEIAICKCKLRFCTMSDIFICSFIK